jgi:CRISPR/Cas system-associated exonuclease Cas4 (RecB family)
MRQVVQVHTIEQWNGLNKETQSLLLKHIRLKERLWKFLTDRNKTRNEHKVTYAEPTWIPCKRCEQKGWVLKRPRQPGIHPSQIPHPCDLKLYNEMVGKDSIDQIEPRVQLIFDIGHAVHGMFQDYGRQGAWGPIYKEEVRVNGEFQALAEEYMIEGSADADNILTIDDIPDAPIYELGIVHEYKTIKGENFNKLSSPRPEHKKQATIYSAILNRPIVTYLYFNKNDSNLVDFPVPFDQTEWEDIKQRCKRLIHHFNVLQPPKGFTGYHCKECSYKTDCDDYKRSLNKSMATFRRF